MRKARGQNVSQLPTFKQLPSSLATTTTKSTREMATSTPPPLRDLSFVSQDGSPTDTIIICGGRTFFAHKAVVCAQSQTLQETCSARTKVRKPYIRITRTTEADS